MKVGGSLSGTVIHFKIHSSRLRSKARILDFRLKIVDTSPAFKMKICFSGPVWRRDFLEASHVRCDIEPLVVFSAG